MKMLLGVQRALRQNVSHQLLIRKASFLDQFCKDADNNKDKTDKPDKSVELTLENAFKLYNLDDEPTDYVTLKRSEAVKLYTDMQTVRRMENACAELYRQKVIRGFCHLYAGQEACCAGMWAAMRPEDTVITSYRSHGWTYLMGGSVYEIMAELAQKQTGCSRGKGGSMHTYAKNFFGGNGIVGSQVPLGAGVGLAHAYRCRDAVSFTLYGDGAANQGQLFESFNLACLWKLPVVFVCENNKYGMGTSANRAACNPNYYTRGDYIPGIWVNGMDVLAVRSATEFCIDRAKTCGPLVMELETYRYYGHSMSDPGTSYRKREEIEQVRKTNDPITRFKTLCLNCKLLTEEDFKLL
ncbi:probable pyruvate dehydrogenase E1 component subunit alpha, mitochondrial [Glossina fuscipes]|uniref:pyruvate dehydrogenase (acetyl-transferring) n=1 Tax=Glossina fuscipes TaxID=7396 RepID=A0A9C6E427_9MUSC|nr:probable pyruvate dehydrogenase E1 component subunit alpha, mitochondrial [Glossina fuscipes]